MPILEIPKTHRYLIRSSFLWLFFAPLLFIQISFGVFSINGIAVSNPSALAWLFFAIGLLEINRLNLHSEAERLCQLALYLCILSFAEYIIVFFNSSFILHKGVIWTIKLEAEFPLEISQFILGSIFFWKFFGMLKDFAAHFKKIKTAKLSRFLQVLSVAGIPISCLLVFGLVFAIDSLEIPPSYYFYFFITLLVLALVLLALIMTTILIIRNAFKRTQSFAIEKSDKTPGIAEPGDFLLEEQ